MTQELVLADAAIDYSRAPLASRQAYVGQLAYAGQLLPRTVRDGAPTPEQRAAAAFYLAEVGAMMGIHPLEAMSGIHLIEGRPTISAGLMSALIRKAGHKLRVSESGRWDDGTYVARAVIIRADDPDFEHVVEFGFEDAVQAGLANKNGPWQQYPKAMCKARVISACGRMAAEDALGGARYTPEELGAEVNGEGEPINIGEVPHTVDPEPQRSAPQPPPAPARAADPTPASDVPPAAATTGTGGASAANVSDEQILSSIPTEVMQHAKSAIAAHAKLDAAALGGIWQSAKAARILAHPAIGFDDLGRPTVWRREDDGTPTPLRAMLTEFGVEAKAAGEAAAQDSAAEDVADAQAEADFQNGETEAESDDDAVQGEIMDESAAESDPGTV